MEQYSRGRRGRTRNAIGRVTAARVQIPAAPLFVPVSLAWYRNFCFNHRLFLFLNLFHPFYFFSSYYLHIGIWCCNPDAYKDLSFLHHILIVLISILCTSFHKTRQRTPSLCFFQYHTKYSHKDNWEKAAIFQLYSGWYRFNIFPRIAPSITVHTMANMYIMIKWSAYWSNQNP